MCVFELAMPGVSSAGSPPLDAWQGSAVACSARSAFGFDNPQYSDRVLHIILEKDGKPTEVQGPAEQAEVLRSMHVNSLTLAANSEVLRYGITSHS